MNFKTIATILLLLNLALVGVIAVLTLNRPEPALPAVAASSVAGPLAAPAPERKSRSPVVVTNSVVQKIDWRMVESEDYKKYIANLRSIGCPEETIRDIIIADVNKLFEDRKKALRKPGSEFKFWETGMQKMFASVIDEDSIKQKQALTAEKKALIKELLGIDLQEKPDLMGAFNPFERLLDFLPSEKQTRIMEIMQDFQAKQVKNLGKGTPDEMDIKEMQKAQKDMEGEIGKMLTPQEFEDYQLRLSSTAMMMRMQLDGFNPSEQEFRDVFKLQKAFDDQFSVGGIGFGSDKDERDKRMTAQKELDDKIKGTLGEQRFAEYQREKDFEYKAISKVAERQGLPKDAAVKVYDMKKVAQEQVQSVQNDRTLSPEQRQATLKAVRAETEKSIAETLGQKGCLA